MLIDDRPNSSEPELAPDGYVLCAKAGQEALDHSDTDRIRATAHALAPFRLRG